MSHKFVPGQYIKNTYLNEYDFFDRYLEKNTTRDEMLITINGQIWCNKNVVPHDNPNLDIYGNTIKEEFNIGDVVECIYKFDDYITYGKTYVVKSKLGNELDIINDEGIRLYYNKNHFKKVSISNPLPTMTKLSELSLLKDFGETDSLVIAFDRANRKIKKIESTIKGLTTKKEKIQNKIYALEGGFNRLDRKDCEKYKKDIYSLIK